MSARDVYKPVMYFGLTFLVSFGIWSVAYYRANTISDFRFWIFDCCTWRQDAELSV